MKTAILMATGLALALGFGLPVTPAHAPSATGDLPRFDAATASLASPVAGRKTAPLG